MNELEMKRIPYGVSNYERIVQRNCYYVDKTMYLETIENVGDYLFFIRPRRFGKSLFLAVLHGYYVVQFKESFDELYKDTWIHTHPTVERGSYLVLPFNFSASYAFFPEVVSMVMVLYFMDNYLSRSFTVCSSIPGALSFF
ncbi:MAG: AAA family ATPase [Acidobacteria bacterium]|jgi:hypothetical protein|nr:AAA family ATPase [Acidobacteriota bacterium]